MFLKINEMFFEMFPIINFTLGCGHCKAMKPAYMEAADELKTQKVCRIRSLCYSLGLGKGGC